MTNSDDKGERWVVAYTDGNGSDDWQLLRNGMKEYFETEQEARIFAASKRIKGKLIRITGRKPEPRLRIWSGNV